MDWNEFWNKIKTFFTGATGLAIIKFVAVFVIGIIVVKILINIVRRIIGKTKMDKIAQNFIVVILKFLLYLIWVLALLGSVGVNLDGVVASLAAVVLAIGMALENNIANLANGIIIVSTKMFKKGDYIIVNGVEGSIENINFLFTTIYTTDNKKVTIPNSTIVNSSVSNCGGSSKRRVEFTFSVAYETDVELVKKIVTDVMKSNGKVYLDPEPFCRLKVLGASSIDFFSNCWCDSEDYWDVYYYIVENVYNEFKRNNVSIPYNQLEVRNRTDKVVMPVNKPQLPARVEKKRDKLVKPDLENASFDEIVKYNKAMHKKEKEKRAERKQKVQAERKEKEKQKAQKKAAKK